MTRDNAQSALARVLARMARARSGGYSWFDYAHYVSTPSSTTVRVNMRGAEITIPRLKSYTPTTNDIVLVLVQGSRAVALGTTSPSAPGTPVNPPIDPPFTTVDTGGDPGTQTGITTVLATGARNYGRILSSRTGYGGYGGVGWWGDGTRVQAGPDPIAGIAANRNRALFFYGSRIATALAGKTVTGAKIFLATETAYPNPSGAGLYTHNYLSQPGGVPTLTDGPQSLNQMIAGRGQWYTVPVAWVQSMIAGTRRGLALDNTSFGTNGQVWTGPAKNTQAGAIRISWSS